MATVHASFQLTKVVESWIVNFQFLIVRVSCIIDHVSCLVVQGSELCISFVNNNFSIILWVMFHFLRNFIINSFHWHHLKETVAKSESHTHPPTHTHVYIYTHSSSVNIAVYLFWWVFFKTSENISLNPSAGERAILIKTGHGDSMILVGKWTEFVWGMVN